MDVCGEDLPQPFQGIPKHPGDEHHDDDGLAQSGLVEPERCTPPALLRIEKLPYCRPRAVYFDFPNVLHMNPP